MSERGLEGVLLLDKEQNMSSAQAIARAKARLKLQKIGHAGTLDPQATGLLVCFTGRATRCAHWLEQGEKEYIGRITFGISTSTDDIWGEVTARNLPLPAAQEVLDVSAKFTGTIEQVPPQVSAIKIDGKPCYARVRAGEQVAPAARRVTVRQFSLTPLDDQANFAFRVVCSAGTYIRSLARDLGAALGSAAVVSELRRTRSEPFLVEHAVQLDALTAADVRPWHQAFSGRRAIAVERGELTRIGAGDERLLRAELERNDLLGEPVGSAVLLGCRDTGEPRGLVVHESGGWRIGVNFMQP